MNILLLGPQGAGKGTQAKRIAAEYGLQHIASGDLYRAAIASGSELGRRVEPILAAGELVQLRGGDPGSSVLAHERERVGDDPSRARHPLELVG